MRTFLDKYINLTDEEYDLFMSNAKLLSYKKNEFLLQAGKAVEKLFFIKSGIIRGYRIIDGVDVTHHFFREDWLATDYESYLTGNPGKLYMETLSDTVIYEFNKTVLHQWFDRYPKFEKLRYVQAEDAYLQMVERLKDFQTKNLKNRYFELITKNPKLFNQVPQKHIASYLGVKPQSLSRIKESVKYFD